MPWTIKEESFSKLNTMLETWHVEIIDENEKHVADVYGDTAKECRTKAELIASAPEMKERLIKLQSNEG